MIVNALNSGAKVFMADFEDASSPMFANMVEGQANLKDRWAGKIDFTDPATGKTYAVKSNPAALMVRPRGWHLPERHVAVDGEEMSGSLFDFGLYVFHCAKAQMAAGRDARLLPAETREPSRGAGCGTRSSPTRSVNSASRMASFKATVLIETLPAAFEMDEILYELRDHIVGLNCGRWDYIFSFIKRLGKNPAFLTPDRSEMTMGKAFLSAYSLLLIKTCHRRGAFAMGGMAAQIPVKGDSKPTRRPSPRSAPTRSARRATGMTAPGSRIPISCRSRWKCSTGSCRSRTSSPSCATTSRASQAELLEVHKGKRTEEGLRENIRVGVQYIEAWLRGRGAVPIYNLMEDAATAEISRAQVWQWLHLKAKLDDGREVTPAMFRDALKGEMERVRGEVGAKAFDGGRFKEAIALFSDMSLADEFEEFLTLPAYKLID